MEEDWRKKNFRMSKNEFIKLVDKLRPFATPDPRSLQREISAEKRVRVNELNEYPFFDCLRRNLFNLGTGEQLRERKKAVNDL